MAVHKEEACAFITGKIGCGHKTGECRKVTVEEIEDESDIIARAKPKSVTHILIHKSESQEEERPQLSKHPTLSDVKELHASCNELKDKFPAEQHSQPKPNVHVLMNEADVGSIEPLEPTDDTLTEAEGYATTQNVPLPPPPKELKPVRMPKKRFYPAGESSVGVLVLAVKGWVGNSANQRINLHLDSCADVTLISSEYYDTLKDAPAIQQGMGMKLWQLMDKESTLHGFVRIPIFMMTDDRVVLESEAEAYVVPGMTVPILLGEDYQLTYELGVSRNVEEGPRIHFGKSDWTIGGLVATIYMMYPWQLL